MKYVAVVLFVVLVLISIVSLAGDKYAVGTCFLLPDMTSVKIIEATADSYVIYQEQTNQNVKMTITVAIPKEEIDADETVATVECQ